MVVTTAQEVIKGTDEDVSRFEFVIVSIEYYTLISQSLNFLHNKFSHCNDRKSLQVIVGRDKVTF